MNEILFESSYERNESVAKEIYRYYFTRQPLMIAVGVLLVFVLGMNLWLLWLDGWSANRLFYFLFAAIYIVLQYCRYRRCVRNLIARDRESYGEAPVQIFLQVTQDQLIGRTSTGNQGETPLSSVKKAVVLKHLVLLLTKAGQFHVLEKERFTIGTWEEFVDFLRLEGIRVRG